MIKRKISEIGSNIYRAVIYPFVRMGVESKTNSVMKQGSYLQGKTVLMGKNFIGKKTVLKNCEVGYGSYVQENGNLTNTIIGKYCAIGSDVKSSIGKHPVETIAAVHPAFYSTHGNMGYSYAKENIFEETSYIERDNSSISASGIKPQIIIGNDVWIGNGVQILEGVTIGDGAVIAAGAVVTKDVEPYSIYGGVPAKFIKKRFSDDQIAKLLDLKWWDKGEDWILENIHKFANVDELIKD